MLCETKALVEGCAADAGWSGDTLLCRWAEATGIAASLVRELSTLAAEERTMGGEISIPDVEDGMSPDPDVSASALIPGGGHGLLIRRFADLSTAHLTEDLASWLEEECPAGRGSWHGGNDLGLEPWHGFLRLGAGSGIRPRGI